MFIIQSFNEAVYVIQAVHTIFELQKNQKNLKLIITLNRMEHIVQQQVDRNTYT